MKATLAKSKISSIITILGDFLLRSCILHVALFKNAKNFITKAFQILSPLKSK